MLHKFFLDLCDRKRLPLDFNTDVNRYIGHIDLDLEHDGKFCSTIARMHYDKETRARSLRKMVDMVKVKLTSEYKRTDIMVKESMNKVKAQKYTVILIRKGDQYEPIVLQTESEKN